MFIALSILVLLVIITAVRLLVLKGHVESYKKYWDERASKQSYSAVTYIALGDSAAQGLGASKPEKGYVGLVADAIGKKTGKPVHVINLSVTGATIQDLINVQIPKLKALKPEANTIITLAIGGNDVVHDLKPDAARAQLDELYKQLPSQTLVADIPSFSRSRMFRLEPRVNALNPVIHETAQKYGLQLVPLNQVTGQDKSLLTNAADLFHPSDRGYRNWFKAFWQVIEPTL